MGNLLMIMKILKKFKQCAKRTVEYDSKQNVTKGEAIERKPLSSYIPRGIGKKIVTTDDVTSHQTEDQVIASCTRWLKANGWEPRTLFTGGIPIGQGKYATNPCKGIPDCIAFNIFQNRVIWIEYKKSKGGIISPEQEQWHYQLKRCGQTLFVVTSLESLKEQLNESQSFKAS